MLDLDIIDSIITDLDGTLVELKIDYAMARRESIIMLKKIYPFPKNVFSNKDTLSQLFEKSSEILRNKELEEIIQEISEKLAKIADKYEMQAAKRTNLFPGVLFSLKKFRSFGKKILLFTVNGENSVNYIIKKFKIKDYFTHIFNRQMMFNIKQNPNYLLRSIKELGIEAEKTLVIGDSVSDIYCGKFIKAKTVGITSGMSSYNQLKRSGADFIIETFPQLFKLFRIEPED
jgi:HAD superfamily hydrolase (TIGR01549 family)